MGRALSRADVESLLAELGEAVPRQECWACDCLQGFLVQVELDATEDVSDLTGPLKVGREEMHGCLGCAPCPPGAAYAAYLRRGDP